MTAAQLRLGVSALAALAAFGVTAEAQRPPQRPAPAGAAIQRAPGDTTAADTTTRLLVEWPEDDSVFTALLQRRGFVSTRYRADSVIFDARRTIIELRGNAAVQRGEQILVSDTIIYNDSTQVVYAYGDTSVLRDPAQQQDDIVAENIVYNLLSRRGVVTNVRTAVESGERWYIHAERAAPQLADSARGQRAAFYGHDGSITSCNLTEPHYHFGINDVKVVRERILVARPAVLYISDIPVMWLPFIFQDLRGGRRSGILTPRFGVSDIVRNSPSYRRQIENLGYYFALNDYMDLELALDWRSGARSEDVDPGWLRLRSDWNYRWLNRFLSGRIGASRMSLRDGRSNTAISWQHRQSFSINRQLSANLNYMTSTQVQRETSFNAFEQLGTIYSSLNYDHRMGPAQLNIGGSRRQYVGRDEVSQDFPTLSIATGPLNIAPWLVWTPTFNLSNSQTFNQEQGPGIPFIFSPGAGGTIDSSRVSRDLRSTRLSIETPLQIFGFNWRNSLAVTDVLRDFPEAYTIVDVADTSIRRTQVFERTFRTDVNWQTGISLPPLLQGSWNLVPSVSIENVDPGFGFMVRTERTGGEWVAQSKRLSYSLSASPTFYGLFGGIGAFSRLRHTISPTMSYSFAPDAEVSDEFLRAIGRTRVGDLTSLRRNALTLGLNQTVEAKLRSATDTASDAGEKLKLLSLQFSSISYDFERAAEVRRRARAEGRPEPDFLAGFATDNFSYTLRSDLLPGFDLRVDYSLFQGSTASDTAKFDPYREGISASFSLNKGSNPFVVFSRIFGKAVPPESPETGTIPETEEDEQFEREVAAAPFAGRPGRGQPVIPTAGKAWNATFNFSSRRQRPPTGVALQFIDPTVVCESFRNVNPIVFDRCVSEQRRRVSEAESDSLNRTTLGGVAFRSVPTTTLQSSFSFSPTSKWTGQWSTTYDFEEKSFASHIVSLQRELHDWRAIFSFTQAPSGNFAFNFFISLNAQPDLRFDYNRQTYRRSR